VNTDATVDHTITLLDEPSPGGPISEMPLPVPREEPAFWLYYLLACLG
jgi:hypothetical protein